MFDLAGRFAVAIVAGISRFYVDAAASLGAVYSTKAAVVASTTGLIPRRGDTTRHELVALLDIPNKDNWFPFGLTPRADIDRLMASHYLDLELWQPKRCWSCPSPGPADDVPELVERIARRAETTIQLAAAWSPLSINLTAGRDSRMLLACARSIAPQIAFSTTRFPNRAGALDCYVASRIATKHGLRHRISEYLVADSADLDAWLERTGHCVAGSSWRASGSYRRHDRATVVGLAGEMGRCYYWREHDRLDQGLSNEAILDRLHLPQSPLLLERCDEWKAHAQAPDTAALIDLLFLEQRLSCWACPLLYGRIGGREAILPFNHRENLDAMLRLPVEYPNRGASPVRPDSFALALPALDPLQQIHWRPCITRQLAAEVLALLHPASECRGATAAAGAAADPEQVGWIAAVQ